MNGNTDKGFSDKGHRENRGDTLSIIGRKVVLDVWRGHWFELQG